MNAARIAAACAAAALVALAAYRIRTGRGSRAALGLLAATLLTLYAADATSVLPDGENAVADAADALGAWTYPFMGAMAFLETAIPPVTLVFPGEWTVMLGGAMAGEGEISIVWLVALVWVCSAAGDSVTFGIGRRLGRPFLLARGGRVGVTEPRLAKLDAWLDHYGAPAVCLGRMVPLVRPFGPLVAGASHFPYRRYLAWNLLGTLLFSLVFCGLGYVFYRSYDDIASALSRSGFAFVLLAAVGIGAYVFLRRRRAGEEVAPVTRVLALGTLITAATLTALLMFGGGAGDGYTLSARFENAGQVVNGGLVEIAGQQVGTVTGQRLTDDGMAELTMEIDDDWAPIPRGTHAQIRQFGLSGPASRYIELRLPTGPQRSADLPDGGRLGLEDTTSNVDIDEIFAIFDRRTRRSLKGVFRGSARQYAGEGARARDGMLYLDPALVSASRLFGELNRDTPELRRFITESSGLVGDLADRRDDLASLVSNLADTTGAIQRPRGALGDAIVQLPPFMRRANTTYVNLRAALDDVDPLVRDFKPVAKKLRPYTAELRRLTGDARPTVRDLAGVIRRRGAANDLVELARLTPRMRDIAVGPVRRNGKEREGALPATAEALSSSTPRIAFARPYSVDFTGWLDDFSHSGNYDAMGGFARIGTHVNAFSFKNGVIEPIAPALRAESLKSLAMLGQNNRCPGSAERDTGDRSTPFRPSPDFNCDPTQVPPGR